MVPMEIIKTKKSCLIFLLLNSPFLYPGEALSPAETREESTPQLKTPAGLPQNGENTPLLASPPFPIPATTKTPIIGPLNNQGQQSQTVLPPQQQVNYPQQSLNQPFSGFTQPFASANQPFVGVNQQPFSSSNQPFGVSNQEGLADNTPLDRGVSKKSSYIIAVPLAFLFAALANLGFIF